MMLSLREEALISNSRIGCPSSATWWYLSAEFFFGLVVSGLLTILGVVKTLLPKPAKDITGHIVLVTGVTSPLGKNLAHEFAKSGCKIVCIDEDLKSAKEIASALRLKYHRVEKVSPEYRKEEYEDGRHKVTTFAYKCDLGNINEIRNIAKKVKDEVGWVDVLVTCNGNSSQDIFDTVSKTLMSHYWTVMAFLPSMINKGRAHIIGVMPTLSTEDAYMGSKAAVAGLMESLGQYCNQNNNQLTFITLAPKNHPRFFKRNDQQIAAEVVQAVRREQSSLTANWFSNAFYQIGCTMYSGITFITQWLDS